MAILVRRVRPDEAQVLKTVRHRALSDRPEVFGSTLRREAAFADEVWTSRASRCSTGDRAVTYLAWLDNTPVGIVSGIRDRSRVELSSMWTSPDVRRRGVGQRLVESTVEWSRGTGAERVELWVTRNNNSAQRLYESLGFVVTGDHQPLPSDPCKDEIRMIRELTAQTSS